MGKKTKTWLIVAAALILAGCIIFGKVMTQQQWDLSQLSMTKFETAEHKINGSFQNISIVTDTADILFVPSENETSTVICHEQENAKHAVSVNGDTLVIEVVDTRKWYELIGINFDTPKIMVYMPQGQYGALTVTSDTGDVEIPKDYQFESIAVSESTGDVTSYASAQDCIKIKTSTGNIRIANISTGTLDLFVSTGKTTLTGIQCQALASRGSTGDIALEDVIVAKKLSIERSTGDVKFARCDAEEIFVETDTGNVTGTLLSEKVFITETDTGKIHIPNTATGGRCEITTDTGNIKIDIE